MNENIEIKVF